jgi:hypothetical protein
VLSKFAFGSSNATGQIDDERQNEAMKKLNVAVEAERAKQDEAVDVAVQEERRKRDEAVEVEKRKRVEAVEAERRSSKVGGECDRVVGT